MLPSPNVEDPALDSLDRGESVAIALGMRLKADLILIDDRKGAAAALSRGLQVTGTLGVLDLATERGLVDLPDADIGSHTRTSATGRSCLPHCSASTVTTPVPPDPHPRSRRKNHAIPNTSSPAADTCTGRSALATRPMREKTRARIASTPICAATAPASTSSQR